MKDFIIGYIIIAIVTFWLIIQEVAIGEFIEDYPDDIYYMFPKKLYETTNLNVFGAYLYSAVLFVFMTSYYVPAFFYWICHTGRKEVDE